MRSDVYVLVFALTVVLLSALWVVRNLPGPLLP